MFQTPRWASTIAPKNFAFKDWLPEQLQFTSQSVPSRAAGAPQDISPALPWLKEAPRQGCPAPGLHSGAKLSLASDLILLEK